MVRYVRPGEEGKPAPAPGVVRRRLLLGPYLVAVLALVSGLAAAGFVLAPVVEHQATYHWNATPGDDAAGLPLNPYRPKELHLTVPCSVIDGAAQGRRVPLVATTRSDAGSSAAGGSATGLALDVAGGRLLVRSQGQVVLATRADWGRCEAVEVTMTPARSTVVVDGRSLLDLSGDRRPTVRGFFTSGDVAGLAAVVVADTRYDTSPTPGKVLLGLLAVTALAGAVLLLALRQPRRWPRFRAGSVGPQLFRWAARITRLDVVVAVALGYSVVVGPVTDDDGFIARIISTPAVSGFVGNYVRWNNTPEAPFGWFYELYAGWSRVSVEPMWLRIPPLLLGLVSWWVLGHLLLPRLLTRPALSVKVGVAAAFVNFWICFGNTLRPEPWVALGLAGVMLLIDIALVRRNLAVLGIAATTAALAVGVGPTGIVAFGPFLIAAPRLVRWLRSMAWSQRLTGVLVVLAGVGVVAVPMFADQSLAAVRAGTAIRTGLGPNYPWWEDWRRYVKLTHAPFTKQWAVYAVAVAVSFAAVVALRAPRVAGTRRAMQTLALGSTALVPPLMALAPTKLNHHFGALMLVGPLVVGLALHMLRGRPQLTPVLWGGAVASLAVGLSAALVAPSNWWELSRLGIPDAARPQQIGGVELAPPTLVIGVVLAVAVVFVGRATGHRRNGGPLLVFSPVAELLLVGLAVTLVLTQLVTFSYAAASRTDRYTLAAANLHTLAGNNCLLENTVQVEPDPRVAALPAGNGASDFAAPKTLQLPTWAPDTERGTWRSGWFTLPEPVRDGSVPLVVRVRGLTEKRVVRVEFDAGRAIRFEPGDPHQFIDRHIALPDRGAAPRRIRMSATWSGGRGQLAVAVPREQRWTSVRELSRRASVTASWELAFFTPCLTPPAETAGSVSVPRYWLTRESVLNELEWTPHAGGPLVGLRDLVTVEPLPTRIAGDTTDPTMSTLRVYALIPRYTSLIDQPERSTVDQR